METQYFVEVFEVFMELRPAIGRCFMILVKLALNMH